MEPFVLAVTGASAQPIAERALELLLTKGKTVDLILSKGAIEVWNSEIGIKIPVHPDKQENFWRERFGVNSGTLKCHKWNDNSSRLASGSYRTKGMIIVPCTMGTIGKISSGISANLIERCADVHLKEKRPLIIAPRETPWNLVHLNNIKLLMQSGATIVPLIPAWYTQPQTINDLIDFLILKLFESFNESIVDAKRWEGPIYG